MPVLARLGCGAWIAPNARAALAALATEEIVLLLGGLVRSPRLVGVSRVLVDSQRVLLRHALRDLEREIGEGTEHDLDLVVGAAAERRAERVSVRRDANDSELPRPCNET